MALPHPDASFAYQYVENILAVAPALENLKHHFAQNPYLTPDQFGISSGYLLHGVIHYNALDCLEFAVERDPVERVNVFGRSPLQVAIEKGKHAVGLAILEAYQKFNVEYSLQEPFVSLFREPELLAAYLVKGLDVRRVDQKTLKEKDARILSQAQIIADRYEAAIAMEGLENTAPSRSRPRI